MEVIVADQIIMGLILHAGDAKQHIYQALSLAKNGEFEKCNEYLELADQALLEAHNLQTEFLRFQTASACGKPPVCVRIRAFLHFVHNVCQAV